MMNETEEITLPNGQKCCKLPGVHIILAYQCKDCGVDTMSFVPQGQAFVPQPCQKCEKMCVEALMFGLTKDVTVLTGHPVIVITDEKAGNMVENVFVPEKKLVLNE